MGQTVRKCGTNLRVQPCIASALNHVNNIEDSEEQKFIRECYERSGFIITEEFIDKLATQVKAHIPPSGKRSREEQVDYGIEKLKGVDFGGDFFEVRDRLEGGEQWGNVCDVVQDIYTENFSGDLKASLGSTFRDAISNLNCPDFVKSMVARGVVYKVLQTEVNGHRIGKWEIADQLAFLPRCTH